MPKAYALLQFNVDDQEKFGQYRQGAAPTILSNGGRVLVAANGADVREGTLPSSLVTIIEFPSREAAETWYASPEYAAVKHLRHEAAPAGSLVFLDGFEVPGGAGEEDHRK
jgi:uncharacterized protein (DUF1330 family)